MKGNISLPAGWTIATVGDLADYVNGRAFKPTEWKDSGRPIIRIQNLNNTAAKYNFSTDKHEEKYKVKNGDLLFAWSASLGAHIWHGNDAWLNQHIFNVLPKDCTTKTFVFYLLTKITAELYAKAHGSGMVHVTKGKFESTEITLPPINEQKRIVAKIEELFSELDNGIESLKTAREQLKVYRQALLKNAFEGKLTAQWREKNKDKLETADTLLKRIQTERTQRFQLQLAEWEANGKQGSKPKVLKALSPLTDEALSKLSKLPDGWVWCQLGEFIDSIDAGKSFKCDEREPTENEIGVAKVSAVTWGEYDESESKTCTDTSKINESYFIQSGDFVLSRANTIDLVGACVIARKVTKKIMLSDKTLRIKFYGFSQEYFFQFLRCSLGRKQIMKLSTGNQESMRNIGQDRIRSIVVPICSGIEATAVFEALDEKLSEIDQLNLVIATALKKAKALRQSILKKAFSGQLVAQDANDEPASVLLARIKAEKARQAIAAKPKKAKKITPQKKAISAKIIPFPVKASGIETLKLHAGIMALAYSCHEKKGRAWYFGHVKAEKISHMMEADVGIELERNPIKDAAGPNDFKRLLKVEAEARKQGWFDVQKLPRGRYVLNKKENFDQLIADVSQAMAKQLPAIQALIELFVPLNKTRAEIVTTLYAAWNNLLLDGKFPSDEEIVTAAREDWHKDKLDIRRERFFKCLHWMRNNALVPQGRGKYVESGARAI